MVQHLGDTKTVEDRLQEGVSNGFSGKKSFYLMWNWKPQSSSSHLASSLFSVTALLRKLKQQSRESVEDKRPKLLKALKEVNFSFLFHFPCFIVPSTQPPHTTTRRHDDGGLTTIPFMNKMCSFAAWRLLLGASLGLPKLG